MPRVGQSKMGVNAPGRTNVIFDFDGTIANTLPIIIEVVEKWGVSDIHLTVELIEELRGMSAQQALKRVGIPLRKVPGLITRGRRELIEKLGDAKPFPGMLEVIRELSKTCDLYVMSSNSNENIIQFIQTYKLDKYFKAIYGNVSVFGKTKSLKRIIKLENLDKRSCVYIGDETRDIEAAHKVKIRVVSVTWGYNNKQILTKFQPDHLVDDPVDLLGVLV